jgi:hypothetical protein
MTYTVNIDTWRAAIKFLCGLGTNPELTPAMQRDLSKFLRGPFANGMDENKAAAVLINAGWTREGTLIAGTSEERTSPGYRRFKANAGAEALIADTLRLQQAALRDVAEGRKAAGNPSEPPRKGKTRRVLP